MKHNPFDDADRSRRFQDEDLTRRILDRTSGNACERAEALLGSRWDAPLDAVEQGLLDGHLAHCAACRELALVLDGLQPRLPALAAREPGPEFTVAVMTRTVGVEGARPAPTPWLERLYGRLGDWVDGLWQRPRFALEAAWTATAILALVLWSPLGGDRDPGRTASAVVTAGTGVAPRVIVWCEARLDQAQVFATERFDFSSREAIDRLADLGRSAQSRGQQFRQWVDWLWNAEAADGDPESTTEADARD